MSFRDFTQYVIFAAACVYLYNKAQDARAAKTPSPTLTIDTPDDDGDSIDREFRRRGHRVL